MNNPLCHKCQRREVDCERFYREKVTQCDDFLEFDPDEPVLPVQVEPHDWALGGNSPTAVPTITDEDAVEQIVDEPVHEEKAPSRRQVIIKWLLTSVLFFVVIVGTVIFKTSFKEPASNLAIVALVTIVVGCVCFLFRQSP